MMLGKPDIHMQKKELHPYLTPYTQIISKWIKDLNVRSETVKLLEENVGGKLHEIGFDNDFFGYDTKTKAPKPKIDKWNYM